MNAEKFWNSVIKQADGCWIWSRATGANGYGAVSYLGVTVQAHRLAWILARGPIPHGSGFHGTIVAHKCDVRACCNPEHLFLTNHSGNMLDKLIKGRQAAPISEEKAKAIVASLVDGGSKTEIAEKHGVSHSVVYAIATKRAWKHLTTDIVDLRFAPREANGERHRKADYAQVSALLTSGKTLRQIAKECGTTHTTVRRVIQQNKLGHDSPFKRMNEVDRERIHDLSRSGATHQQIADWIGVSRPSVSRTLMSTKAA